MIYFNTRYPPVLSGNNESTTRQVGIRKKSTFLPPLKYINELIYTHLRVKANLIKV